MQERWLEPNAEMARRVTDAPQRCSTSCSGGHGGSSIAVDCTSSASLFQRSASGGDAATADCRQADAGATCGTADLNTKVKHPSSLSENPLRAVASCDVHYTSRGGVCLLLMH